MARYDVSAAFRREAERLGNVERESGKAVQRAVGTLARRLPVEARRDIAEEYSLTATRIREGLSVSRGEGFVELRGSKRGIGLINFGARWGGRKSQGTTVQVLRGKREMWPDAFIATGLGGNRQMFVRDGRKGPATSGRYANRPGVKREKLKALYGPSIAQMLRKAGRSERLADFAQATLATEFERLLGGSR